MFITFAYNIIYLIASSCNLILLMAVFYKQLTKFLKTYQPTLASQYELALAHHSLYAFTQVNSILFNLPASFRPSQGLLML